MSLCLVSAKVKHRLGEGIRIKEKGVRLTSKLIRNESRTLCALRDLLDPRFPQTLCVSVTLTQRGAPKSGALLSAYSIACNATHNLPSKIVLCIEGRDHFTTSVGEPREILSRH
jgi:hypothetical protein